MYYYYYPSSSFIFVTNFTDLFAATDAKANYNNTIWVSDIQNTNKLTLL